MLHKMMKVDTKVGKVKPLSLAELQNGLVRKVYERDSDPDKVMALKELGAVYWIADFNAPPTQMGYTFDESVEDAIKNYELPSNWQPDKLILQLIDQYKNTYTLGAAGKALVACLSALNTSSKLCIRLNEALNKCLSDDSIDDDSLGSVVDTMRKILSLSNDIPKSISALRDAKENIASEEELKTARGGMRITNSMRPENQF